MKFAVFASLLASAAAFAPAKQATKASSLAAFEGELGVQAPVSSENLLGDRSEDLNAWFSDTRCFFSFTLAWILRPSWYVEQCFRSSFPSSS